jgi:hypothetical protein
MINVSNKVWNKVSDKVDSKVYNLIKGEHND